MFQKWKQPLILAACVWALLAFIAAQSSSTCGAFFSGDCLRLGWQRLSHIVLLAWVWDYQTLIAGVAALGAGAFVLLATRMQLHAIEERDRKKEATALSSNLYDAFQRALDLVTAFTSHSTNTPRYCQDLLRFAPQINRCSPRLGTDISRIVQKISIPSTGNRNTISARLQAAAYILAAIADYIEKNPLAEFPIRPEKIQLGRHHFDRICADFNVKPRELDRLQVFFAKAE